MKKRLIILLAVVMTLSLILAACSGGMTPPAENTPAPEPAPAPDTSTPAPEPVGEVFELTLMNHEGPNSATARQIDHWCAAVLEASGGQLVVTPFHGSLGGPRDTYNMVVDGSVDIGWGLPSFYPGMFPASDVIALPFIGAKDSMQAGHAMSDLYTTTDYLKEEWSGVKVIMLHTNIVAPLITKDKKIEKLEDLKGLNIRTIGGPPTEWAKLVGANPMTIDLGEIYTSMEKGVINAITSAGWEVVEANKFYELGDYFLDFEMQVNPCFFVMNWDAWNKLPPNLQAVIDEFSGAKALEVFGPEREAARQVAYDKIAERGGEVYKLSADEQKRFAEVGDKASDIWRENASGKGIDADALRAKAIELLAKYAQ
jgi:TRAP-type C4-dicarboxylate transport system substrate-binding protein